MMGSGPWGNRELLTSEFQRWYPPRDLSVESIPNRKSKILKPPHLSVGSISNLKSQISNRLTVIGRLDIGDRMINGILTKQPNQDSPEKIPITNAE